MANPEHLAILKQGVEVWNEWRRANAIRRLDLSGAYLKDAELGQANLIGVDLTYADLSFANLNYANLIEADMDEANLSNASLLNANLSHAGITQAKLIHTDLRRADCRNVDFKGSNLTDTNLTGINLYHADLRVADLTGAKIISAYLGGTELNRSSFTNAQIGWANFGNTDLRGIKGLHSVIHLGPSTIGIDTLYQSGGNIPESFLRGCGLSDWQIENVKLFSPDLSNEEINNIQYRIHDLRVCQALQINPLFISYSHSDGPFVDKIEKYLIHQGIRFWRDIHHATAGRLEKQIDRAIITNHDVVLLVLSEHSTASDWVEHETRKAREKEKKTGKDALCPIALDDSWKTCRWPDRLREQIMEYNILDFSNWQDEADFQTMFGKLLEGLNLFYK